jgi:hypothetical protein
MHERSVFHKDHDYELFLVRLWRIDIPKTTSRRDSHITRLRRMRIESLRYGFSDEEIPWCGKVIKWLEARGVVISPRNGRKVLCYRNKR